jgi:sorbitol-specific phosphotransferase system component IIBC
LSQTGLIKCKNSTIKKSKDEHENLKAELSDKRKQLKEVEKKKDSLKTVDKLMKKQTVLLNRSKRSSVDFLIVEFLHLIKPV